MLQALPTFALSFVAAGRLAASPASRAGAIGGSAIIDYSAGFLASAISTSAVYPVECYKVRLQAGNAFVFDGSESPFTLLRGIELGLLKECPNAAIYLGAYEWLRFQALELPQLEGLDQDPLTIFCIALVCGALSDAAGSPLRLPFELVGKNVQAGTGKAGQPFGEALAAALPKTAVGAFVGQTWLAVLARDMPFGALQLCFYELAKLAVAPLLGDDFAAHLIEGGLAGGCTAIVTTPVDCSITRLMLVSPDTSDGRSSGGSSSSSSSGSSSSGSSSSGGGSNSGGGGGSGEASSSARAEPADILQAAVCVWEEQGAIGFTRGWAVRALQFAPAAMLFFASYETLKVGLPQLAGAVALPP